MARQSGSGVAERKKTATAVAGTSLTREQLVEFYRLMYVSRRTAAEDFFSDLVCGA